MCYSQGAGLHVKFTFILCDFSQNWNVSTHSVALPHYHISWKYVVICLSYVLSDRQGNFNKCSRMTWLHLKMNCSYEFEIKWKWVSSEVTTSCIWLVFWVGSWKNCSEVKFMELSPYAVQSSMQLHRLSVISSLSPCFHLNLVTCSHWLLGLA